MTELSGKSRGPAEPCKRMFAAWNSYDRELTTVEATSPEAAADVFAMRNRTPTGIVVRVVDWDLVHHYTVGPRKRP